MSGGPRPSTGTEKESGMADQSDVATALVTAISGALYPNGTGAVGVIPQPVKIYRGWPGTATLRTDLGMKVLNVTVFPEPNTTKNTTRWMEGIVPAGAVAPTLTVSVQGADVTVGGTVTLGQLVGILADGVAFIHRARAGDTLETVAEALGAMIATKRVVTVSGTTVSVAGAVALVGRTVADQPVLRWIRSQMQHFRVSCWCPDPLSRDAVATAIDVALAQTSFLDLADGSNGWLHFLETVEDDEREDAALFRRDLLYAVDYPTTLKEIFPTMIFGDINIGSIDGAKAANVVA